MSDALTERPMLLTGFPGFLTGRLVERLAADTDAELHLLCLEGTAQTARSQLEQLEEDHPSFAGRWRVHTGDITRRRLGLDDGVYEELTAKVGVVWHLAAIYDLAVDREIAYRVNVGGTVNVLDFCEGCDELERLNYVSTCYVAGRRTDTVYEEELDVGQHHHNHYEETKFWAEVEVQRRSEWIPTAIFRPSIVVGDSETGETAKYDGPYYVFQLLDRLPDWLPVPSIGRGDTPVNLVPVDFIAESLAALGHREGVEGVFQLADPEPMTARQIVDQTLELMGRNPTVGRMPRQWVERALNNDTVEQWTGLPREALTYFEHQARFDTTRASRQLQQAGVKCPPLSGYLERLVDFYLRHPDGPPGS